MRTVPYYPETSSEQLAQTVRKDLLSKINPEKHQAANQLLDKHYYCIVEVKEDGRVRKVRRLENVEELLARHRKEEADERGLLSLGKKAASSTSMLGAVARNSSAALLKKAALSSKQSSKFLVTQPHRVYVKVLKGTDLVSKDADGTSDPFVVCVLNKQQYKTATKKKYFKPCLGC